MLTSFILYSKSHTALYHAALKPETTQGTTKMAVQSKEASVRKHDKKQTEVDDKMPEGKKPEVATIAASTNRNCAVTIWNLPDGTTEPMILEAIAEHKPNGSNIYACDVYVISGPNNIPPAMSVASVRFMRPETATRLVQIGNKDDQGIYVKGKRAKITLAHRPQPAYRKEPASRVVIFRGPHIIVNPVSLRKLWGFKEQTERLIIKKAEKGLCEIEWRFCSYAYNAEPAFCVFEDAYGKREDCSVRYGDDPCA
ncbi:hypothetical protein SLS64_010109 [Diaporthe eres]